MSPPAEHLACRGISGERELLCFFCLAGAPSVYLAERIRSSPARRQEGTRRAWGLGESAESGRLSPCQPSKKVSVTVLEEHMQQPLPTTYADIAEVRTVSGAAACNQLLAVGVYPITTVAENR